MPDPGTVVSFSPESVTLIGLDGTAEEHSIDIDTVFGDLVGSYDATSRVVEGLDLENLSQEQMISLVDSLAGMYDAISRARLLLSASANIMKSAKQSMDPEKWPQAVLASIAGRCSMNAKLVVSE